MERPECELGYPVDQLMRILGDRFSEFLKWMTGQTFTSCTGTRYNYLAEEYEPTGCGPHGFVYYEWDVKRFLSGLPVID
jgi:hypothetical protein